MVDTWSLVATLVILAVTIVFFALGKFRSDAVAFCALLALVLTGVLTPTEALSGLSNSVIMTIACMLIVSAAIVRSGLANMIGRGIQKIGGTNQNVLFMLIMLLTALIGSLVSNTGTVAIMMPIVASMAAGIGVSSSRFLMPLAFMGGIGGMLTLIGNPGNMVVNDVYVRAGYESLTLFSYLPVGLACLVFGLLILAPATSFFLSKRKDQCGLPKEEGADLRALAEKYGLAHSLYKMILPASSPAVGKSLAELNLTGRFNIMLQEIRRAQPNLRTKAKKQISPDAKTVLQAGDVMYCMGSPEHMREMAEDLGISSAQVEHNEAQMIDNNHFDAFGICELVLMSSSNLVKSTIAEARLGEHYGITVIGIMRGSQIINENLKDETLQAGDSLLVQGPWDKLSKLQDPNMGWVVVGTPPVPKDEDDLRRKMPFVVVVLFLMILCMALSLLPTVIAAMLAVVALVLGGLFRSIEDVYSAISWEPLIMIACMLPLAVAMEKSGIVGIAADQITSLGTLYGPLAALALVYAVTSALNIVISITPVALLMAPVGLAVAQTLGLSPLPFIFAVATASCMCFASPYSTPSNALVMSAGRYTFFDYLKIGLPLQILMGVYMVLILPKLFPF